MTKTATPALLSDEAFASFLDARDEPAWLVESRREAWRRFGEMSMPSRDDEEWRRTDIRTFRLEQFGLPSESAAAGTVPTSLLAEGVELGGWVTSTNSLAGESQLEPRWAKKGVLFGSLDALVRQHEELLRPNLLQRAVDPSVDKFAALHAACWSGGTLLYVPPGVVIDEPLHTLSVLSGAGVDFGHLLVILGEGAQATLLAETAGDAEHPGLHCGAVELLVGRGARLRFVSLQNWGLGVWHFAHQKAIIEREGSLQWTIGALGSRLSKVNQHVALVGEGATAEVNGVMFTEGRQHLSYHTLQLHEAPGCKSDLLYKGALQDHSRVVWRGMIKVDPDSQKTNAYQRNDNLLLSADARADSIPGLEIEADDVICTHGATIGRVDDEQVFYAQSRGLSRNEAIRMIVAGFFQQVFDRIAIESVRDVLARTIGRRIRQYD